MTLKVTILGCGTSSGVPIPGLGWGACDPNNPKNRRKRVSILIQKGDTNLLVDAGPDLREQLLINDIKHLEGVFITHAHADHIHGLDDLRWINVTMKRDIPCFTNYETLNVLFDRFGYVFTPLLPDKAEKKIYHKPLLIAKTIEPLKPFTIGEITATPFEQDHGFSISLGLRVDNFAYCTDVFDFPDESWKMLEGLDCWVVDCLGHKPHPTHAHLERVLGWIERIKPKRTYFTHMNTALDYDETMRMLPSGVEPAYDQLIIDL